MTVRTRRSLRAIALAAAALLLAACSGLPTSGDVQSGLALGASPEDPDFLPLASGPADGAGPAAIVEGFMEAAITTDNMWETARTFLSPELAATWRPTTGVSIDQSAASRTFSSTVEDDADASDGDSADVRVRLDQVATVDETGAYSEAIGASTAAFVVVRTDGQWRITEAPDGIVIDASRFARVYESVALQYFDQSWTRLVPDVRWFPRRATIATTIAQSLIGGVPSPWLDPAVQSAFPPDVELARDAVPINAEQVAEVELSAVAASLDATTLARMRTQLQSTLEAAGVQVSQVRFSVDGRTLDAGVVKLVEDPADVGTLVLKDGAFGTIVGGEITPISGVTDDILAITQPIAAIDVAADGTHAAVQLTDGSIFVAGNGSLDEIDAPATLVRPSVDAFGYIWSVPANAPSALQAWDTDVTPHPIADAWPGVSEVSSIRVAADGARVAAVVVIGGERWIVVSAVIRDDTGMPLELGPVKQVAQLSAPAAGLVWLGTDRLGVLTDLADPIVRTQIVGGIGTTEAAPAGAVSIAGSRSTAGIRVLDADGVMFARSGSAWGESASAVTVLATRAGH